MQKAVPVGVGAMAALIGLDFDAASAVAAEAAQGQVCQAANDNGGGQVVVSGDKAAVERAVEIAKGKGAKRAMLLPVSAPFHCALMQPAADVMARGAVARSRSSRRWCRWSPTCWPSRSRTRPRSSKALVAQVTGTVRWRESVAFMARAGVTTFYEVGAGKVLSRPGQAHRRRRDRKRHRHARRRRRLQGRARRNAATTMHRTSGER